MADCVDAPTRNLQADLGSQRYSIAHLVEKRRDILRFARSLPRTCREVRGETGFDKLLLRFAHYLGMRVGWMLTRW